MVAVAIHVVFFWVLSLTMKAKVVDQNTQKQEIKQNVEKSKFQ